MCMIVSEGLSCSRAIMTSQPWCAWEWARVCHVLVPLWRHNHDVHESERGSVMFSCHYDVTTIMCMRVSEGLSCSRAIMTSQPWCAWEWARVCHVLVPLWRHNHHVHDSERGSVMFSCHYDVTTMMCMRVSEGLSCSRAIMTSQPWCAWEWARVCHVLVPLWRHNHDVHDSERGSVMFSCHYDVTTIMCMIVSEGLSCSRAIMTSQPWCAW